MTARGLEHKVMRVERGEITGDGHDLSFPEIPIIFRAGELHAQYGFRESVANDALKWRLQLMAWLGSKIKFSISSVFPTF